jgi:hypothetical protein
MLSSSPAKIHEPRVTGVSPDPRTGDSPRKLRNTRYPVGAENRVTASDQDVRRHPTSQPRLPRRPAGSLPKHYGRRVLGADAQDRVVNTQ